MIYKRDSRPVSFYQLEFVGESRMTLQLTVTTRHPSFSVISAAGEIDATGTPAFAAKLDELIKARRSDVVIDLTHVTIIDPRGIAILVKYIDLIRAAGGQIRLVALEPHGLQVLELTQSDGLFSLGDGRSRGR